MKNCLPYFIILVFVTCCSSQKEKIPPPEAMQKSSGKVVIYQMMTRLFGNKTAVNKTWGTIEENGVGKFNDIDAKALKSIKELGINHVCYTGVLEHAVLKQYTQYGIQLDDDDIVKCRAGSP